MTTTTTDGFLIVDKAPGMTSHDVVAIARRALNTRKVGHAGTLDPMATGVLVLGFGSGTRLLQYITDGDKSYRATVVLGASTVSDDVEGKVLKTASAETLASVTNEMITSTLDKMRGTIHQRPSSVSAVKIDGERAHARVRAGEEFELPTREVTISQLDIVEIRRNQSSIEVDIEVTCSAGTFIRAIARDCGDALSVGGHLNALSRTRVASFTLSQGCSVDALKNGDFTPLTIVEVARSIFPIRNVGEDEALELTFGRSLSANSTEEITGAVAHGTLLALLRNIDGVARPIAVFAAKN
ncbi:MAG: tRNA pseudouridine(55) synthase TruB [Actinobacteria bacterium]|uniref:tRNA pseudouridine(55) synthase n=1 Tax=freshwater metagenome TaxID=449393 RepID=A0A6J7DIJ4_9ZZZZ|nr:tRNA pseudouridine(55) synthase TruB [Actinomycetota bacterium]MSX25106.1 tRNA pseudouridine(55) synthase TruB [Actinomycetota bacterium]MSY46768.1 tRNA pseudouridine(55) synthase TruB [Actinomycetota bacterium]MSY57261.1 tRNA pseudouridine(55) synthase TruB [Actinomycetota bacterium]MTB00787.1 tRNA pseudouridine(55) synthase TruB [Actinomycetota bacterium]